MTADELLVLCEKMPGGWWSAADFRTRFGLALRDNGVGRAAQTLRYHGRLQRRGVRDAEGRETRLFEYRVVS